MEWWAILGFFIFGLMFLILSGFPIAFAFLFMDILGIIIFMGPAGLIQMPLHIISSVSTFTLMPIPMFILMGELMFHSQIAYKAIDVIDKWLMRVPGRLGLVAAASGTIFAATSGSTLANTAMLGTVLLPEMQNRGYKTSISVGSIIGIGGIAMLIPPSSLAVVMASIGNISVGDILVGGIIPGILMGVLYSSYIIIRCILNPSLAPAYKIEKIPLKIKIIDTIKYIAPFGFIIFMVLGLMLLGIAAPSEAAAVSVVATLIVILFYGKLNCSVLKASLSGTLEITVMTFMIILASKTFASILAFTGVTRELLNMVQGLNLHPILILLAMQALIFIMATFMETISIMMICLPIYMPIAKMLGFDPVWFGILMLINFEIGMTTPPFGIMIFVMKGVAPPEISIKDICYAALPFILCDMAVMGMIILVPELVTWLPS